MSSCLASIILSSYRPGSTTLNRLLKCVCVCLGCRYPVLHYHVPELLCVRCCVQHSSQTLLSLLLKYTDTLTCVCTDSDTHTHNKLLFLPSHIHTAQEKVRSWNWFYVLGVVCSWAGLSYRDSALPCSSVRYTHTYTHTFTQTQTLPNWILKRPRKLLQHSTP